MTEEKGYEAFRFGGELDKQISMINTHLTNYAYDPDFKPTLTRDSIQRVRDLIKGGSNGGVMDLVWGPQLEFSQSSREDSTEDLQTEAVTIVTF